MIGAKIFLFLLILLLVIFIFRFKYTNRFRIMEKLTLLTVFFGSIIIVIEPKILENIANLIGIERGKDLIFYLYILLSAWGLLRNHARINSLNSRLNKLISTVGFNAAEKINKD